MTRWLRVGVLLLILVLVGGCNIFESFAPSESASDFISDGREALREGNYDAAIEAFDKAIQEDPQDARAHWGIAKAFVRKSGYTSISIMTELSGFESASGQNNLLPFMDPFLNPIDKVNLLYEGLIQANEHLQFIHSGQAWSTDLDGDAIALDYTGTLAVEGILLFRDTNSDGHINAQDVNLMAFFDGSGNLSFDPNAWLSVIQDPNQDPEAMLQSALDVLGESSDVLAGIVNDLAGDSIATGIDTENLDVVIEDLLNGVQDYWNNTNP